MRNQTIKLSYHLALIPTGMLFGLLFNCAILSAGAAAAQPLVVENAEPYYRFELPLGFQTCPVSEGLAESRAKSGYVLKQDGKKPVYVFVQHLGQTMPQNVVHDGKFPADIAQFHPSVFREKWKGFDLFCVRYLAEDADKSTICLSVFVPLKAEAIRLDFQAPSDQEHDLDIAMKQIIPTLEGESNWLTAKPEEKPQNTQAAPDVDESAPSSRLAVGLKGLAALFVVVGLVALVVSRRHREAPIRSVSPRPKVQLPGGRKPDEPRR